MGSTRASSPTAGLTLDAGALIALDRGDRRMIALLQEASKRRVRLRVPAGVIGQAWRDGRRQATLARFLRAEDFEIHVLGAEIARAAGELCRVSGTSDVIDATVVIVARANGDTVLTGDRDDLLALDPSLRIERV